VDTPNHGASGHEREHAVLSVSEPMMYREYRYSHVQVKSPIECSNKVAFGS
jgi:hypothetical protein